MALSFSKRNGSRGRVGLDIDGRFLAAIQVEHAGIERAASVGLPEGIVRDGEVVDGAALSGALKDFFKATGMPTTVQLGVANRQILVREIELPRIEDPRELDAAIRFQAADAIAMPLDEAVLDYHVSPHEAAVGDVERVRVTLVAARTAMIARFVEAARGAGLKVEGIDLDAFALVRALSGSTSAEGRVRVYCHLAGITNLAVALDSACNFTRPLSAGWDSDPEHVAATLGDEIRHSIDSYMTRPDPKPVDELVLSGPGSLEPGLAEDLGAQLGLPVSVPEPLGELDPMALPPDEDARRHTVAAGLALGVR